ncbi:PhzF family phenazine biosynthesis protein [Massilia sp. TW-1]|uniref:PhzF family phenazine biosynthesis protein n=1 Tax=Telluria antibiotica TaxID=2717319 RepID=A0ABX0P4H0_9BURK|nr:PhzF family phenazine biosynthesis protein [Telluria antibiotica]NIA52096.1 PhzF family phenazine biosynthesis protein [Telluria antibiotica]
MAHLPFKTVDVFTAVPFMGNPLAVVFDADDLSTAQMQRIANWTNLSETTFVLRATQPGVDYRVRIFTPGAELPFAGHPTIGTAHALLEAGRIAPRDGALVQECAAGRVALAVRHADDGARWLSFDLPPPAITPLDAAHADDLAHMLGTPLAPGAQPCLVDAGPRWVVAQLPDATAVLAAAPDLQRMKANDLRDGHTGVLVFGPHAAGSKARIEVRAFAPAHGIAEDPVCGSGNGAVAAYLRHTGQLDTFGRDYIASQGAALGRAGFLKLSIDAAVIRVGGNAVTCVDGHLAF